MVARVVTPAIVEVTLDLEAIAEATPGLEGMEVGSLEVTPALEAMEVTPALEAMEGNQVVTLGMEETLALEAMVEVTPGREDTVGNPVVTPGQEGMEVGSLAATPAMEVTPALEAMEVIQGVTLALEVVSWLLNQSLLAHKADPFRHRTQRQTEGFCGEKVWWWRPQQRGWKQLLENCGSVLAQSPSMIRRGYACWTRQGLRFERIDQGGSLLVLA